MQVLELNSDFNQGRKSTRLVSAQISWWLSALFLLCFLSVPAQAQYSATLQGTVADSGGALIPGASITITATDTNRKLQTTSDGTGNFFFGGLAASVYKIEVSRTGFESKVIDNFKVLGDQANGLNIKMEVGGTTETVTVNASAQALIDTETGSVGATISQNEIAKLPSFGRDVFQLIQLSPGVFGDGSQSPGGGTASLPGSNSGGSGASAGVFQTENQPQATANGGRTNTNAISLDGVGITSVSWGGAAVITPAEDSIKEFKVVASDYDAEYGRANGGQIQVTSQNGTNQYHGTAFFKMDRPGLNAYQRWDPNNNPQRDNQRFNQFGGTVGGPILHNKLFGFFSYETIRNNSTGTGGGWYDTASFDGSSAASSVANKFLTIKGAGVVYSNILEGASDGHDCANVGLVQGVNCNWIQGKGLDIGSPLTSTLGTQDPGFAAPYVNDSGVTVYTPGVGSGLDGNADIFYVATVDPSTVVNQQFMGRVDYQMTTKDLIAADGYITPVKNTFYNGANRASNLYHHNSTNYATGLIYNHTFSSSLLNEARGGMSGWKWGDLKDNPQAPFGLPSIGWNAFASTTPAGFGTFSPTVFDQWTFNAKDTLTKVYKSHNIKLGGNYTRLAFVDAPTWDAQASYNFNNMWDFINDAPQSEGISADPKTGIPSDFRKDLRSNLMSVFAQDDWKAQPNLTINLGLRWDYFGGMTEKFGHLSNMVLGTGANTLTGISFTVGTPQNNAIKSNFGPQIGFAWSPSVAQGKLVVRGGFGVGFDGFEYAISANVRNNPPYISNSPTLTGKQIVYGTASNIYSYGNLPSNPNAITQYGANNLPVGVAQLGVTGVPQNLKTQTNYRFNLEGKYDLGNRWVATVGYSGNLGRHLTTQGNLNNEFAPQVIAGDFAFNPQLNNIDWYENRGVSSFNSLTLEVQHQFAHTFEVDGSYRWAKSLDEGSQPYAVSDYDYLPGYNYGPSDFDVQNAVKVWGLWSPVIFHGDKNWMEKAIGGWSFSGITNFHSGFPFDPTYTSWCSVTNTGSVSNPSTCNYRPTQYLGGVSQSQSIDTFKKARGYFPSASSTYFVTAAQPLGTIWPTDGTTPMPGALPTVPGIGRNAFRGPRYFDTDFTVTKAFGLPSLKVIGDSARLELRANAYNIFNQLNLASPDTGVGDTNFGRATNVQGSRTVEVEAHFKF